MPSQKPKFAVLGNLPADLAQEVSSAVETHPSTSAVEEIDGLLIHGPTATPDLATLKQHLDAGKILTFHQPTDEHLNYLLKLVGFASHSGISAVSYFKNAAAHGYTVLQEQPLSLAVALRSNDASQDNNALPNPQISSLSGHLERAWAEFNTPAPPLAPLVPPRGAPWGTLRVVENVLGSLHTFGPPTIPPGTGSDDKNISVSQPNVFITYYADYYVYWTNGDDGTGQPYFYLIRYDNGQVCAGTPVGTSPYSLGYCSALWQIYPVTLGVPANWTLSDMFYSPESDTTDSVDVIAQNLALPFYVSDGKGGKSTVNWTPGTNAQGQSVYINQLSLKGWGVARREGNDISFYQHDGWNAFTTAWQNTTWANFWHTCYVDNDPTQLKLTVPDLSQGAVPFAALWAWQLYQPNPGSSVPYPKPGSCQISIQSSQLYYVAFFIHGTTTCKTGHMHTWLPYLLGPSENQNQMDLGVIVRSLTSGEIE